MMNAIDLRYSRQKEATDQVRDKDPNNYRDEAPTLDKVSPQTLEQFAVRVKR